MLPFREITLEDKAAVEKCGSHYNYSLTLFFIHILH